MSLEELWNLFPISFVNYNVKFEKQYLEEEELLKILIGKYIKRINHIGSTAIKNIRTKPIVDILIEINYKYLKLIKDILLKDGYILMDEGLEKTSFNKGYTAEGYADKVFHIHIKEYGNCDELYFRYYLNEYENKAKEYETLKLDLYNKYKLNRDLYTNEKKDFVNEILKLAKEKYKDRYNR